MGRSWRIKKTAAKLREGSGPPKVRVTSTLYRSHAALEDQLTRVMGCQKYACRARLRACGDQDWTPIDT